MKFKNNLKVGKLYICKINNFMYEKPKSRPAFLLYLSNEKGLFIQLTSSKKFIKYSEESIKATAILNQKHKFLENSKINFDNSYWINFNDIESTYKINSKKESVILTKDEISKFKDLYQRRLKTLIEEHKNKYSKFIQAASRVEKNKEFKEKALKEIKWFKKHIRKEESKHFHQKDIKKIVENDIERVKKLSKQKKFKNIIKQQVKEKELEI